MAPACSSILDDVPPGPVVAIAAHADDAELNAGGLLAKAVALGRPIHIVMVTNNCSGLMLPDDGDERGAFRLPPAQTTAVRHREQLDAAKLLGAEVHHLGYAQRHFWDGSRIARLGFGRQSQSHELEGVPPLIVSTQMAEHIERMRAMLASLQPALVLTQTVIDLDPEHHAVAALVWQAMRLHRDAAPGAKLLFWTPGSSCEQGMFDPGYDHIEDISEHYETKMALCMAHRSQMTQQRLAMVRRHAEQWGGRIGVRFAEPYKEAWW